VFDALNQEQALFWNKKQNSKLRPIRSVRVKNQIQSVTRGKFFMLSPGLNLLKEEEKEREGNEKGKRKEGKRKESFPICIIINRRRAISLTILRPLHNSGQPEKI